MAGRDTARRPSQADQEFVRTRDGRRVRNECYDPKLKKSRVKKSDASIDSGDIIGSVTRGNGNGAMADKMLNIVDSKGWDIDEHTNGTIVARKGKAFVAMSDTPVNDRMDISAVISDGTGMGGTLTVLGNGGDLPTELSGLMDKAEKPGGLVPISWGDELAKDENSDIEMSFRTWSGEDGIQMQSTIDGMFMYGSVHDNGSINAITPTYQTGDDYAPNVYYSDGTMGGKEKGFSVGSTGYGDRGLDNTEKIANNMLGAVSACRRANKFFADKRTGDYSPVK